VNETRVLVLKITASDSTLAEQHEAFGEIVRRFQDMAYAVAYSVLGDFHLAEDAAQEAFITAWQKLGELRQPEAFPGWFRRIVLTECNRLRRGKRLLTIPLEEDLNAASTDNPPQAGIENDEVKRGVFRAIGELSENERMVVALFYLEEYSQSDISRFLEVPTTTVAKRLYSARVHLRGRIKKDFKEVFMAHRPSRSRSFAEKVRDGIFDEYVGEYRYELRPELTVNIRREGNKLLAESNGQTSELFAENDSETELSAKEFDGRGRFVRDKKGRVTHVIYYEFGQEMGQAKKIS
jgi:RNA polymerase sigma factor (sigma-70 family)